LFDWANQRAFIWFVDRAEDPLSAGQRINKNARTRRVDIWIGTRKKNEWKYWQTALAILFWLVAVALIVFLQQRDWKMERAMGYKPWAGVKLTGGRWND
jgi:hypothetical protein